MSMEFGGRTNELTNEQGVQSAFNIDMPSERDHRNDTGSTPSVLLQADRQVNPQKNGPATGDDALDLAKSQLSPNSRAVDVLAAANEDTDLARAQQRDGDNSQYRANKILELYS